MIHKKYSCSPCSLSLQHHHHYHHHYHHDYHHHQGEFKSMLCKCKSLFDALAKQRKITITLKVDADCENLMVFCDLSKISQAVANLMNNAIKFAESNSTIVLWLSRGTLEQIPVSLSDEAQLIYKQDVKTKQSASASSS